MKEQSIAGATESRPVWESLERFARQGVQRLLQQVLEEEVEQAPRSARASASEPPEARMVAHVTTRRKGSTVHRYSSYRCSFATHKGPAVCLHRVGYRQDRLEAALLEKFREAMTPQMIDALAQAVNAQPNSGPRRGWPNSPLTLRWRALRFSSETFQKPWDEGGAARRSGGWRRGPGCRRRPYRGCSTTTPGSARRRGAAC